MKAENDNTQVCIDYLQQQAEKEAIDENIATMIIGHMKELKRLSEIGKAVGLAHKTVGIELILSENGHCVIDYRTGDQMQPRMDLLDWYRNEVKNES